MAVERADVSTDAARLGEAVRRLRRGHRMTLSQLAARSQLSHSFLSQLERGLARPSMHSLYRIALALGTSAGALLDSGSRERNPTAGSPTHVVLNTTNVKADGVSRVLVSNVHAEVIEYLGMPLAFREYWQHAGEELTYIAEGIVELDRDGELSILRAGDSVCFSGGIPHRVRQLSGTPARVVLVCFGSYSFNVDPPD